MHSISCEVQPSSISKHVQQLYTGFFMLKKRGLISLTQKSFDKFSYCNKKPQHIKDARKTHLRVVLNGRIRVYYDNHDSWEVDEEFLSDSDIYFKRSYSTRKLESYGCLRSKIYPLGLNYLVYPDNIDRFALNRCLLLGDAGEKIHSLIGSLKFLDEFFFMPRVRRMEALPCIADDPRILFMVRAWNPFDSPGRTQEKIEERKEINETRAACVNLLKSEFKDRFYGGFIVDEYTKNNYPGLLMPDNKMSSQKNYIKTLKSYPICIATTGLHGSIGWKFAEYIAFSKAILSEKLNYEVPGGFSEGTNYLEFTSPNECAEKAERLMSNGISRRHLMYSNAKYYNDFLRPDSLILNTIITALSKYSQDLGPETF